VIPETLYAKTSDDVWIAYQVVGTGAVDLILVKSWVSHLEVYWEQPRYANMVRSLAKNARVIDFDKRGTGLSDRVSRVPDLEARMDDIRAVMDAAGSGRAVLFGWGDGAALAALFAATYPDRTAALILNGGGAKTAWSADYPWGMRNEDWLEEHERMPEIWGRERHAREWAEMSLLLGPHDADDPELLRWVAKWARYSAAPGNMLAFDRMWLETDVRDILPTIQVPTVVTCKEGVNSEEAGWVASRIPGARVLPLAGDHRVVWMGDLEELSGAVGAVMRSARDEDADFDRLLATVLFTDIVDSTSQSAAMGDHAWRSVQDGHDHIVRAQLARCRGREIRRMGDGFLATFDGPGRAVRCAQAISGAVRPLGIEIRAGLHTGEIRLAGEDIEGLAVAIGARVGALAGPSEVLVSSTVRDLVAGSGLELEDRGLHSLKGVPDEWRLFAVAAN
jgi:class 3 adenylate cyclase/pimeloyl-ACP methyl ester carboxylesterase